MHTDMTASQWRQEWLDAMTETNSLMFGCQALKEVSAWHSKHQPVEGLGES